MQISVTNMIMMEREDPLVKAVRHLGEGSCILWTIFILTITPQLFTGMHSMSYIFIAQIPTHWCSVAELTAANWTDEQIRNISSASPCTVYNYNYTELAQMGFDKALLYKNNQSVPTASECTERSFANDIEGTSLVQDWDLVCDKITARTNTYTALSLGKLFGSCISGLISDKFGRKVAFSTGLLSLIISGPVSAVIPWYWGFIIARFCTGFSFSTIQMSSFTILTEVAGKKHRQWMGVAFNTGYPIGTVLISCISYIIRDWRQIQLITTLPALILFVHMWYMPESPQWLITHKRREEAQKLVEKYYGPVGKTSLKTLVYTTSTSLNDQDEPIVPAETNSEKGTTERGIRSLKIILFHYDLRRRMYITYFAWCTVSLCYYVLALNAENMSVDQYTYTLIMGLSEIPAYLIPGLILTLMRRKHATFGLFAIGAICLLSILILSETETLAIMTIALIGRFALSAVFGIVILYTSELFPTVCRNTAIGTGCSVAHCGSVAAPFVADLLGMIVWWGPTTVCGALALIAGLLCLMLPETGKRSLANTVEEEMAGGREKVSLCTCCKCT